MALYQFGAVIKKRREELFIGQKELAEGICSVPTLSRIENGDRIPSRDTLEMLIQRLGLSDTMLNWIVSEDEFTYYDLKIKLRHAYMQEQFDESRELLNELKKANSDKPLDKQFVLLYTVLLNKKDYTTEQKLEMLEEALRYTSPSYTRDRLPSVLFYEEILVLNNIAIAYHELGETDTTIKILYHIDNFYSRNVIHEEEAWRTQPMILYNLSKYLGMAGRIDECITVCEKGIKLAQRTGRCKSLAQTLFNLSWVLLKRSETGDYEKAKEIAMQAYHMASIMGKDRSKALYTSWIKETFDIELD